MASSRPSILWFRQDLRLADQAAVLAAASGPVACVHVLDDDAAGRWKVGGAARWWLHHSLASLDRDLRARGNRLILLKGDAVALLSDLARGVGAVVHALDHAEPWYRRQQEALGRLVELNLHEGITLGPLGGLRTEGGAPFKVFSPFWRALQQIMPPSPPTPAPDRLIPLEDAPAGDRLEDWALLPRRPNWAAGFPDHWRPGEAGAMERLEAFGTRVDSYKNERDFCALDATARLSPHLHFGEVSPAQVWHFAAGASGRAEPFLRQLGWRDFSLSLLMHSPDLGETNWRPEFDRFPWASPDGGVLDAWRRGQTGYPIVDAGMRQLWRTGWMHNRVRMVTASFLVKHLLIDWRVGADWFWDTLVDADMANNAASWQWVAGSGADAAPYFRIFNPMLQGAKFDPRGDYVRRWVPALAGLPAAHIHAPWEAPSDVLAEAGIRLGLDYPRPIVDHAKARAAALAAFATLKEAA